MSVQERVQSSVLSPQSSALKWLARLSLGLLIVGVLLWRQGEEVRRALQSASWLTLAAAVIFYWSTQLLSAAKWQLLLNSAIRNSTMSEGNESDKSTASTRISLLHCYRLYL